MANAARDNNNVPTLIAVSEDDGATLIRIKADPVIHVLSVEDAQTGSDLGPEGRALRDENFVTSLLAVSSSDGVTPVAIYATADGKLLVDSN